MKKKLKSLLVGLAVPCLLLLGACSSTEAGGNESGIQERTLRAGIGLPKEHPEGQGLVKFKEIVEEKTDGKITIDAYFNAQLGDDQKMVGGLQAGTLDITIPSTSPMVGTIKQFGIFDFPFLFNNGEEADAVLDGPVGKKVLEELPQHGLVGLAYWENGFRNLTNSVHPVESIKDFKGLKIRTMQNEVHLDVFQELGSNPTPMPFSEVFTALEGHTIDGQENPLATILSNKFYEVQDYLSLTRHVYTPFIFLISQMTWEDLSEEEQKIIKEAAIEAGEYQRKANRKANEEALQELKEKGIKVNEFPQKEKEKIKKQIQPVIDKYSKKYGEELYQQMNEQLKEIRSQN
ncbi:TRAP transporter substrate-binding protein [Thalassobacillus pellis]|uniref:TRAP transporter substrate-binding protein n=1 Tax=Thalassobacillus pellis TaxID=748008 RepID=UPI001961EE14|nr:TRAP transporter substrate-binding protein [Thalassobacillus pellis]MBM7551610.1 tripartite ATP-independent transporter DctP family solute receptor [Thalassobacillus pellis]